jgi:hypothetical protein
MCTRLSVLTAVRDGIFSDSERPPCSELGRARVRSKLKCPLFVASEMSGSQDGDVRVGVSPKGKEVLVGGD